MPFAACYLCFGTTKMTMLLEELKEKLRNVDEVALLEMLNINSDELVNRFADEIEENIEKLIKELDD